MRRRLRVLSFAVYGRFAMLINCAAYQDGKKLGDIAPEDIGKYVSRPECFVWVAMKDTGPGELARPRVLHRDPHEALGPADVLADVLGCDVPQFFSVLIGRAVDQHCESPVYGE